MLDETCGRRTRIPSEHTCKVTRTHAGFGGQSLHRQVLPQIIDGPGADLLDLLAVGCLQRKRGAELRLASAAPQIQDHLARNVQRNLQPQVVFNERQREIHAGCYSSTGVCVPIAYVDWIGVNPYVLEFLCELGRRFPMCGCALAIYKTS